MDEGFPKWRHYITFSTLSNAKVHFSILCILISTLYLAWVSAYMTPKE